MSTSAMVIYPIGKSIVAVNLALKLFPATVANADIGSLKSLHTLFDKYLDHMLVNLNKIVWFKLHEILSFLEKKKTVFKNIFDKALTPFLKMFL